MRKGDIFVDIKCFVWYNTSVVYCHDKNVGRAKFMIEVTRLKGAKIIINAELIETVEETPDTVITLTSGKKFIVSETSKEITDLVINYKRKIHTPL